MKKSYPSSISREQFELILAELELARKKTRPRKIDRYNVFFTRYHVLKSGCEWRMLLSDLLTYRTSIIKWFHY